MAERLSFPEWRAELRRLLTADARSDVEEGGWSEPNARRYYDEGFSPASASAELRFRELARS